MKFDYDNVSQYYCSNCGNVLKEISSQIEISCINEECSYCGRSLQQTLQKSKKGDFNRTTIKFKPHFRTAINSQISLDIPSLNAIIPSIQFGDRICIIDKSHRFISEFLPRFKVMAIRQDILPVVFVDAENCANPYRWVYYARQYGIDIWKALDNVLVSRMFTIYQLQNTISNIDKTLEKYNSKVLIVSDILKLFSDVKEREGERVLKEIVYDLARLNDIILLVTLSRIPSEKLYKLFLPLFNKKIITHSQRGYHNVRLGEEKNREAAECRIPNEEIILVEKV